MRVYPSIGVQVADILLPRPGVDLSKWAVIACDQFTSQPEYWRQVEALTAGVPSTYHMILPEVLLGTEAEVARIQTTQQAMRAYLDQGLFEQHSGVILVERTALGKTRHGVMLALDLENYDYNKGSQTLIRATEGTILERLPPRMRIRQGAPLELPHILVLIDDPQQRVIEPLVAACASHSPLYDFNLMLGSGHLRGWEVPEEAEKQMVTALESLADAQAFHSRYSVDEKGILLFAVGDGNHSLATAKAIWEQIKTQVGMDHPSRFALVEVENIHDPGLEFEPIHRVCFKVREDPQTAITRQFGAAVRFSPCASAEECAAIVHTRQNQYQTVGMVTPAGAFTIEFLRPSANLPVGTLQSFLDVWLKSGGFESIDYVHGEDVVLVLGQQQGNVGFILPAMPKSDLFKTVILDGALPRKTFSMGEAKEKRFYMECRRIA